MSAPDHEGLKQCPECDGRGCAECGGLGEVLREGLNGEPKAPEGATRPTDAQNLGADLRDLFANAYAMNARMALDADEGTGGEDAEQPCDPAVLADLLSLVLYSCPPAEFIATWTSAERIDVEAWAAREHLSASDNKCERLSMPAVLVRSVRSMEAGS